VAQNAFILKLRAALNVSEPLSQLSCTDAAGWLLLAAAWGLLLGGSIMDADGGVVLARVLAKVSSEERATKQWRNVVALGDSMVSGRFGRVVELAAVPLQLLQGSSVSSADYSNMMKGGLRAAWALGSLAAARPRPLARPTLACWPATARPSLPCATRPPAACRPPQASPAAMAS
jgi:hypothetical protein